MLSRLAMSDSLLLHHYSLPGSSVHGISQARILEWVAISSSKGSSLPKDGTCISGILHMGRWIIYHWYPLHNEYLITEGICSRVCVTPWVTLIVTCVCGCVYIPMFFWMCTCDGDELGRHIGIWMCVVTVSAHVSMWVCVSVCAAAGLNVREWVLVGGCEPTHKGGAWNGILVFNCVWCVHACVLWVGVHLGVHVCRKPGSPRLDFSPCSQEMPVVHTVSPLCTSVGAQAGFY